MLHASRFLEVSLPAPDIQASLAFYRALGFTEIPVNDVRSHQYAAVTDGALVLGLHGGAFDRPALTFVQRDLARHVRALADRGMEFAYLRLATDEFNEAGVETPEGQLLAMVEAPTFSGGAVIDAPAPLVGGIDAVLLRVTEPLATAAFLTGAGFAAVAVERYTLGLLTLILVPGLGVPGPAIKLQGRLARSVRSQLEAAGIVPMRKAVGEVLVAPEGTWLVAG